MINPQSFYNFVAMVKRFRFRIILTALFLLSIGFTSTSQIIIDTIPRMTDTIPTWPVIPVDTTLRIKNFSPYFTLHVDSTLEYQFEINRDLNDYYWYLKNPPVGLRINKDNGLLRFKAEKSYFLSGKLKYDHEYKVQLGVQSLNDATDKVDTIFTILFYNTDIIPSRLKPSIPANISIDEGDTLTFKLQCDEGSFPIESITYVSNFPIKSLTNVTQCGDDFTWVPPYDFIKESENLKEKKMVISFIGVDKFMNRDTARINVTIKETINYPQRALEYAKIRKDIEDYITILKGTFRLLDKKIKGTKNTRTTFDLTSASTALGGTIFSSLPGDDGKTTGKILPSVGVALVPVKEAVAPNKNYEQNSASLVRNSIKRLQYLLSDNSLVGDRDPDILKKYNKLKEELKQVQIQLIDVPMMDDETDVKKLDEYFNDPKVNRKYRLKNK